jgi:murein DD-endopeptidase MepM/ murein hydrolase activator NlpD
VLTGSGPSGAASRVVYAPFTDAPVVDPFRPPPGPYAAGNRGIEYATVPGSPVRAAADGVVTFAGPVAGQLHVTVGHADGIRTSYSYLASIAVVRGQRVRRGQPVGTAAARLHVGARRGDIYLDPASLWSRGPPRVVLVPLDGAGGPPRLPSAPPVVGAAASPESGWHRFGRWLR